MFKYIFEKLIGSKNERDLKKMRPIVDRIAALEVELADLKDAELQQRSFALRNTVTSSLADGVERETALESALPEAFATVREASKRVLGMRHFDVQIIGGIVLHRGAIAEMKTGEGKTLVATLPVYLNALAGRGVHVVTVNDYLARRDAEWMGGVYRFLGLTVGCIQHDMRDPERKSAYAADITYGTNNEYGFDYLRDNMKFSLDHYVQRGHAFGIVDEVDSILIDEARTPLIISGPTEENTNVYYHVDQLVPRLRRGEKREDGEETGDFHIDEKARSVSLTDSGIHKAEQYLAVDNLYDPRHMELLHHVHQALRAHALYKKDVDYVVKEGEVIIVDEFTGRLMPGRRWSEGLHQAVEAKEGVKVANENQTLATITFQNYFRLYDKLSGMTGTADTEAAEFHQIYKLEVSVIPTNRPLIRHEFSDVIYKTEAEKFKAVCEEIVECNERGQPVLVGTISIENSEKLAGMLRRRGVQHNVLNAKYHEREAEIIAQAGRKEAVTIATNMAGRGTDIILGGNPPDPLAQQFVVQTGGLHIIGTERHESRRIDNQLRGRAGRQGDPGSSRFYLSLGDDLMRIFGGERMKNIMDRLGVREDEPIEHKLVSKAIENAQRRVEDHNFSIRKHTLEYDDVMNKQREVVYEKRRLVLDREQMPDDVLRAEIKDLLRRVLDDVMAASCPEGVYPEEWAGADSSDFLGPLREGVRAQFGINVDFPKMDADDIDRKELKETLWKAVEAVFDAKEQRIGTALMCRIERHIMLEVVDTLWKDHLLNMDHLKEGIGLRGWGQKDPLTEFKREGYELFEDFMTHADAEAAQRIMLFEPITREQLEELRARQRSPRGLQMGRGAAPVAAADGNRQEPREARGGETAKPVTVVKGTKVGRNDPCPCGSGKKYKRCCGQ
ncbi:MAG: preprotein translocase subunit SecA [Candidatus Schekmanbacteria bacterium]|nr:preprotein translocase subunit SecA [Candidatus Schekmanbacteria bacterium]